MLRIAITTIALIILAGCETIAEKTTFLSDEKLVSEASGGMGYSPDEVTLVSRRTSGGKTYAKVRTNDGKNYRCTIVGGNIVSGGMTSPAICRELEATSGSISDSNVTKAMVMEVQETLNLKGYDAGHADGVPGKRTNKALAAYQIDMGYRVTNGITKEAYNQLTK